jgi:hypothetical protein
MKGGPDSFAAKPKPEKMEKVRLVSFGQRGEITVFQASEQPVKSGFG